ncbi:hypothetical protein CR513_43996, partial [Mucuna pruriens]
MKIDMHVKTLSMEFSDNLVQFNIFEVMKHPTEDHSLFGVDIIDELVEECMQLDTNIAQVATIAEVESNSGNQIRKLMQAESDFTNQMQAKSNSSDQMKAESDSSNQLEAESDSGNLECKQTEAESNFGRPISHLDKVCQPNIRSANKLSPPHSPPTELKPLLDHLKYGYLDDHQHFPIIIANNLHLEQEEKLLNVLKKHKKAIGWTLFDLPRINPSICMHKILLEELCLEAYQNS